MKSNVLLAQHESGETRVFDTLFNASLALKISAGNISRCLAGDRQTAAGYRWFRVRRLFTVISKKDGKLCLCIVKGKNFVELEDYGIVKPAAVAEITGDFYKSAENVEFMTNLMRGDE